MASTLASDGFDDLFDVFPLAEAFIEAIDMNVVEAEDLLHPLEAVAGSAHPMGPSGRGPRDTAGMPRFRQPQTRRSRLSQSRVGTGGAAAVTVFLASKRGHPLSSKTGCAEPRNLRDVGAAGATLRSPWEAGASFSSTQPPWRPAYRERQTALQRTAQRHTT